MCSVMCIHCIADAPSISMVHQERYEQKICFAYCLWTSSTQKSTWCFGTYRKKYWIRSKILDSLMAWLAWIQLNSVFLFSPSQAMSDSRIFYQEYHLSRYVFSPKGGWRNLYWTWIAGTVQGNTCTKLLNSPHFFISQHHQAAVTKIFLAHP